MGTAQAIFEVVVRGGGATGSGPDRKKRHRKSCDLKWRQERPCSEPKVIACACANGTFCTTTIVVVQNVVQ